MKKLFSAMALLLFFQITDAQYKVTFKLKQPAAKHAADSIFVAGNFTGWSPADVRASGVPDTAGITTITIPFISGSYEYKITRGNWSKRECSATGEDVANRNFTVSNDTTIFINIAGWKDDFGERPRKHSASAQVKVFDTAFFIPQLNRTRRVWIYLPKSYQANTAQKYAVLYMHDGQNVFDDATSYSGEWGVDEFLDSLPKNKKQLIVVGIDNGGDKRMAEYNPYTFRDFGTGQGNEYVTFLAQTLKPFIDRHYRTLRDKNNTFIAGSSMGGLISFYAVLKYPNVYGGAGIFSPAFWTAPEVYNVAKKSLPKVTSKLFFYAGGAEGEEMTTDMKKMEALIKKYSKAKTTELIDANAQHNETAWRKYFPAFYNWITK